MTPSVPPEETPAQPKPGETVEIAAEPGDTGERLDIFLARHFSVSRGRAHIYVQSTCVNGAPGKAAHKLKTGDLIAVVIPPDPEIPVPTTFTPASIPPILYEDDDLMVLVKPSGLVVHPGAGQETGTLVDILRASGRKLSTVGPPERAGIVHRLDKDTSGLIIVCKTDAAHWAMADGFATRRVRKNYLALVCGVPNKGGRVEAPIARHPGQRTKMAVIREGRQAITEFTVVQSWPKFALLDVDLLTGRTHQIRVHLAYVHHPVVGDELYGGLKRAFDSAPNEDTRAAIAANAGQALHAARLSFAHPVTGVQLSFESPMPPEMQLIVDELTKAAPPEPISPPSPHGGNASTAPHRPAHHR